MNLQPITFKEAKAFVAEHHRHHQPPQGWLFGVAINDGERVVGVIMVGRPVSRHMQDGFTAEVTRCCVLDGYKNACSMLYGAAWRAARALGYKRIITYTLPSEGGGSLRGAGWQVVNECAGGGSWNREDRKRVDKHPLQAKLRWEQNSE